MRLPFTQRGICLEDAERAAWLAQSLPPEAMDEAERHMASCPDCLRAALAAREEERFRLLEARLVALRESAATSSASHAAVTDPGQDTRRLAAVRRTGRPSSPRLASVSPVRDDAAAPASGRSSRRLARVQALRDRPQDRIAWFAAMAAAVLIAVVAAIFALPSRNESVNRVAERRPEPVRLPPSRLYVPAPEPEKRRDGETERRESVETPAAPAPAPAPSPTPASTSPERAVAQSPEPAPSAPAAPAPPQEPVAVAPAPSPTPGTPAAPSPSATSAPPAPSAEPAVTRPESFVLAEVSGEVWIGDRLAKSGDAVGGIDVVRTLPGATGSVVAGGATIRLDQGAELALRPSESGPAPSIRLAAGRIFVESAPGLRVETPAGTLVPVGTAFAVSLAGKETTVAMREGTVRFETAHGKIDVKPGQSTKCVEGRAPKAPARIADPAAEFAWVDEVAAGRWFRVIPPGRRAGVVIAAPHAPFELQVNVFATGLARRLGAGAALAYAQTEEKLCRYLDIPGETAVHRALFDAWTARLREAAGGAPVRLLVEIHAQLEADAGRPTIDGITAGFTKEELERLKRTYEIFVKKHRPSVEYRLVFDLTDPTVEHEGRTVPGRQDVTGLRKDGVFRKDFAARALLLALPKPARTDPAVREVYEAILAEWLEGIR